MPVSTQIDLTPPVDELQFCGADVRKAFEGKAWTWGMALQAQLILELRDLTEQLRADARERWEERYGK